MIQGVGSLHALSKSLEWGHVVEVDQYVNAALLI